MSRRDKLIARMRTIPADFGFDEMETVFRAAGFELVQEGGSHCFFINAAGDVFHAWRPHGRGENRMPRRYPREAVQFLEKRGLI